MNKALLLASAVALAGACSGGNLLRNPEFRGDNLGGLLNWNVGGVANVLRGAGPGGSNVLRFTRANGRSLAQMNFTLAANEKYRFGAHVRTRGVKNARLLVYNAAWEDSANIRLPADTAGEWRELEWRGEMFPSKTGRYYFRLFCDVELGDDGVIELAAPFLEPLSAAAEKGAAPAVLDSPRKVRIVPVDPLLSEMDADLAKMEFYYPGDLEDAPSAYAFAARLDDGHAVSTPLDERRRGTVEFGKVAEGGHVLKVRLFNRKTRNVVAADEYPVSAKKPFAGAPGRPLNNFVTELARTEVADGAELQFDNPRDGWVYIGFSDSDARGEVFLDGGVRPVVVPREHESCDTLRFLKAGRHVVRFRGRGATVVVNAVKLNFMAAGGGLSEVSTLDRGQYGLDFRKRYFFNRFARYDDFNWTRKNALQRRWSEMYAERGAICGGEARLGAEADAWGQSERLLGMITNSAPYRDGLPVSLDESSPVATRLNHATLADAAWALTGLDQPIGIWWNDCLRNVCSDPRGQATELAAVANSGRGQGLLLPEVYIIAYPDRERVARQEDHFVEFLSSIRSQVPAAAKSFMLTMGGYTLPIGWCGWVAPEADLKVLYDDFIHRMATDPACRDIGGIGYTGIARCDEEILRWFCRLVRHYAIEGRTERLAPKFGFTYLTGTVRNNDFDKGLDGWVAAPAEPGSIAVTNINGFGINIQGRKMVGKGCGDNLAVFTRSAKRPNRLSQKVTGLIPGRLYALACASVDADDLAKPCARGDEVVFRLSCGDGGEPVPELCYDKCGVMDRRPDGRSPWGSAPVAQKMLHRLVFRAKAPETEISFSDWADAKTPGGTIGARRMFNHVNLRLYYVEGDGELDDLKKIFPKTVRLTALDAPPWPNVKPEFYDAQSNPACRKEKPYFTASFISATGDDGKGGSRTFRLSRKFVLKEKPLEAWLQAIGDDVGRFRINGRPVAEARYNHSVRTPRSVPDVREVSGSLRAGENEFVAEYVANRDFPGGVLAELFVRYADGSFERVETDESWPGSMASGAPPAPNRWIRLPYRDFASPQRTIAASVTGSDSNGEASVSAGGTIPIRCEFAGRMPKAPFDVVVTLNRGETEHWRLETRAAATNLVELGGGRWRLDLPVEAPLYFDSGTFDLRIESDAICTRGKKNDIPCGRVAIRRAASIPGFERPVESCVRMHGGSPEVFVNGRPVFLLWGSTAAARRPDLKPRVGDMPLTAVTVCASSYYWNPRPGAYDFTFFDAVAERARRESPGAYFIWDLNVYPSRAWGDANREELATDDHGDITGNHWREEWSYPSQKAVDELKAMIGNAIRYLEAAPYANRILGYRVTSGYTIEWLGWRAKNGRVLDFSKPAREGFRAFAADHYPELADAFVPTAAEREELDDGWLLWDPKRHLRTIAYMEYYSQAVADCALALCGHAKAALGNRKIVGTYYGYTMYLNSPGGDQMRAHFALEKMLKENNGRIDYLMSPQCYGHRRLGDSCLEMKPFASLAANGIVSVIENDTRTHSRMKPDFAGSYQTALTEYQSVHAMRRDMSIALCHRSPAYFYALESGTDFDFPAMAADGATLRTVGEHCLSVGAGRHAEVAVVVSEKSITHMPPIKRWVPNGDVRQRYLADGSVAAEREYGAIFASQVFLANLTRFARAGAPVDYLLAEDLPRHAGRYGLYVFQNAFVWDDAFLKAVEEIRRRGATILWMYAPGFTHGLSNSTENMKRLTGIGFELSDVPLSAGVRMAADGRFMGTPDCNVKPAFVPISADEVVGTYDNGRPGLAMVRTGGSQSWFYGGWQVDVPFLLDLYRRAGVHVYCDTTDPVEANDRLVTLHARFPGRKTIRLPRKTTVLDVYGRRIIARGADSFTFSAELHSSHLFYFADDAEELLKKLR